MVFRRKGGIDALMRCNATAPGSPRQAGQDGGQQQQGHKIDGKAKVHIRRCQLTVEDNNASLRMHGGIGLKFGTIFKHLTRSHCVLKCI